MAQHRFDSVDSQATSTTSRRGSKKVARKEFDMLTSELADESKSAIRAAIYFGEWEGPGGRIAQISWAWDIIKKVASEKPTWSQAVSSLEVYQDTKKDFITYVRLSFQFSPSSL